LKERVRWGKPYPQQGKKGAQGGEWERCEGWGRMVPEGDYRKLEKGMETAFTEHTIQKILQEKRCRGDGGGGFKAGGPHSPHKRAKRKGNTSTERAGKKSGTCPYRGREDTGLRTLPLRSSKA